MRFELEPFNIKIKLIGAGGIKTDFKHEAAESTDYEPLATQVRERKLSAGTRVAGPEGGVAEAIYKAATDGSSRLRYSANGAALLLWLNRFLPSAVFHRFLRGLFMPAPRGRR
jgi:short-subunit dehydrogenase